jgi:hypothetical protein
MRIELKRLGATKWLKEEKRVEKVIDHRGALTHAWRIENRVWRMTLLSTLADSWDWERGWHFVKKVDLVVENPDSHASIR